VQVVCPLYGISLFLPTIIRQLGYESSQAQLMTVPIYITAAILAVVAAYFSDKVGKRSPFIIGFLLMMAVGFAMCIASDPKENPRVVYGGVFVAACAIYPAFPGVITWLSNNLSGSLKRSVGMAVQIGVGNLGGVSKPPSHRVSVADVMITTRPCHPTFTAPGTLPGTCSDTAWSSALSAAASLLQSSCWLDSYTAQELSEKGDRAVTYRYVY
jgi:MFS family permease